MGKTVYLDKNMNDFKWSIDIIGNHFEDAIFQTLKKRLRISQKYTRIFQTERNNDRGKDIVIKSSVSFDLFGINIKSNEKCEISVYIECKFSTAPTLSIEKIGKNLIQFEENEADYFVLITNSQISAYAYNLMEEQAKIKGIQFIIIDKYLLAKSLGENHILCNDCNFVQHKTDLIVAYQAKKSITDSLPEYEVNLLFRNYSGKVQEIEFSLKTDVNWYLEDNLQFLIEPYRSKSKKIIIKKHQNIIDDDIILAIVKTNSGQKILKITNPKINYHFEIPFLGNLNKKIFKNINDDLFNSTKFSFIAISGNAGVGKSRIIKELISSIQGTSKIVTLINHNTNLQFNLINELEKSLNSKGVNLNKKRKYDNFLSLLNSIEDEYQHNIIIIEDCHNASQQFLNDLKKLAFNNNYINNESNITLIISGRTDYTHSNKGFLSLIEIMKKLFSK